MRGHPSFVVFSLPRSRSAWLSAFLSTPGRVVGHDLGPQVSSVHEFMERAEHGACETGAAFAWRLIRKLSPDTRFVVIRRPVGEVVQSLARFGLTGYEAELAARSAYLDEISAEPDTLTVNFRDLAHIGMCGHLYRFCLVEALDHEWWNHMDALNIQVDMPRQLQMLRARYPQIEALKADVRRLLDHD